MVGSVAAPGHKTSMRAHTQLCMVVILSYTAAAAAILPWETRGAYVPPGPWEVDVWTDTMAQDKPYVQPEQRLDTAYGIPALMAKKNVGVSIGAGGMPGSVNGHGMLRALHEVSALDVRALGRMGPATTAGINPENWLRESYSAGRICQRMLRQPQGGTH